MSPKLQGCLAEATTNLSSGDVGGEGPQSQHGWRHRLFAKQAEAARHVYVSAALPVVHPGREMDYAVLGTIFIGPTLVHLASGSECQHFSYFRE